MTGRVAEARGRSYPHTIENGGGERLTFVARRRDERGEFEILEAPAPARRVVFPVIVAVGKLLGLHRRFAGAPQPVRRPHPAPSRAGPAPNQLV